MTECLTHSEVREVQVWYAYGMTFNQILAFYPLCENQLRNVLNLYGKKGCLPVDPPVFDLETADLGTLVIPELVDHDA